MSGPVCLEGRAYTALSYTALSCLGMVDLWCHAGGEVFSQDVMQMVKGQ